MMYGIGQTSICIQARRTDTRMFDHFFVTLIVILKRIINLSSDVYTLIFCVGLEFKSWCFFGETMSIKLVACILDFTSTEAYIECFFALIVILRYAKDNIYT